jgi:hypothetical protein
MICSLTSLTTSRVSGGGAQIERFRRPARATSEALRDLLGAAGQRRHAHDLVGQDLLLARLQVR